MAGTVFELAIKTSDGECLGVPGLEVGVRYRYASSPATWSTAITDGDGVAHLIDIHPEPPVAVDVFSGERLCGSYDLADCCDVVLEV